MHQDIWSAADVRTVADKQRTSIDKGLTFKEADKRLRNNGLNIIETKRRRNPLKIFFEQFKDFMIIVLLGAVVASCYLGEITDAVTIIAIVLLNAILGFVQEFKSERALEALGELQAPRATVTREGKMSEIAAAQIVVGDLIHIKTGDKIPADARLVETNNLQVDESILTGENYAVDKNYDVIVKTNRPVAERINMVHSGTMVTRGHARAIVTATGSDTEIGQIANMIQDQEPEVTPLQVKLNQLGKVLIIACMLICVLVSILGIIRGESFHLMLLTGISLAVAAIPEGLPAIVTICLSIGVQRMSKRNAIVRRLKSVEVLGCATVICTDKTGTLTKNEMTVRKVDLINSEVEISGTGYSPLGEMRYSGMRIAEDMPEALERILMTSFHCNDAEVIVEDKQWRVLGDPTEGALKVLVGKSERSVQKRIEKFRRIDEIPFEFQSKMMAVLVKDDSGREVTCVKGACGVILDMCSFRYDKNGRVVPMDSAFKKMVTEKNEVMASSALRVLAFATGSGNMLVSGLNGEKKVEKRLVFSGLVGMSDPARPEARNSVLKARKAGIRTVMITGDHALTATSIAEELGILRSKNGLMTGEKLDTLRDSEFFSLIDTIDVYARVTPSHKLRIIKGLKAKGEVVVMTGDGVNDAPAIKGADVGISMGKSGTDVSREASSIILVDDDYSTIISAVEEGRGIYNNIRKFIRYLLGSNTGEILTMLIAVAFGMPIPITPIQILWMNLVTDGLPAMALAMDKIDDNVMQKPPRDINANIFSGKLGERVISQGISVAFGTICTFGVAHFVLGMDLVTSRTMAFSCLVLVQMIGVFRCRKDGGKVSIKNVFSNKHLFLAVMLSVILQILVIYLPWAQKMFNTAPLGMASWTVVIGFMLLATLISALLDAIRGK